MDLKEKIITEIKKIYDPEIPVNIYELGLIYDIIIEKDNNVKINMTLTSPNCPVAESLPKEVKDSIMKITKQRLKEIIIEEIKNPTGIINFITYLKIRYFVSYCFHNAGGIPT